MKKISLLFIALLAFLSLLAQNVQLKPPTISVASNQQSIISTQGISSTSAFLVADLVSQLTPKDKLREKYAFTTIDDEPYVSAFIILAEGVTPNALMQYGVKLTQAQAKQYTAQIPLRQFVALAQSGLCSWLDAGIKSSPRNDLARTATNVNQVYNGTGTGLTQAYKGNGVVVGIIDGGFEYGHPTFYDSTETTYRVKRVWDQNATTGPHPTGYSYGKELTTQSAILAAEYSQNDNSHGTHVAGIAAGSGGINARQYRGMAPEADIVLVATTMSSTSIYDGITYIQNYAASVNKPCVINMSIGSHVGPHDGTSSFDRQCDNFTQLHPNGLLLVGAAGNEGNDNLHISKTFSSSDTLLYTILDWDGSSFNHDAVDFWGSPNTTFGIEVGIVNASGAFEDASSLYLSSSNTTQNFTLTDNDGESTSFTVYASSTNAFNNRPNITLVLNSSNQTSNNQRICIIVYSNTTNTVHGWCNQGTFINGGFSIVVDGNSNYSVGEIGGVGNSMITVGAYTTRNSWQALDGNWYSASYSTVNDIANFSSLGPTLDNRCKPDITAPGQYICSSSNRYDPNYTYSTSPYGAYSVTYSGHTEYYFMMQGTSMATPVATGILALWLQYDPSLSIATAKQLLRSSAITDSYTGTIPANGSNTWGHGKINALGGFNHSTTTYTITTASSNPAHGSVSGGGSYPAGFTATLTALPNAGYAFDHWQDGNSNNPRTISVTANATYTAYFVQETVDCTITHFPWHEGFENGADCWQIYDHDGDGYCWSTLNNAEHAHSGNNSVYSITYIDNTDLHADDYLITPKLAIPSSGVYQLKFYAKSYNENFLDDLRVRLCVGEYTTTSSFNIDLLTRTSVPASYTLYTIDLSSYDGREVYIVFEHVDNDGVALIIDDISIEAATTYTITATSANNQMGSVSGGGTYVAGSTATLTATPKQGYRFVRWQDGNTTNPRIITVTANATYTAYFEALPPQSIDQTENASPVISVNSNVITITGAQGMPVRIYDMSGRIWSDGIAGESSEYSMPAAGVYMVRLGDAPAQKVVIL
ncbi:MAG: S8 family serine peptidase [Bacteroidales bacterium]|nr:S8 family serine peptidase [Candidatus Colimorpha merdihippi]